MVEKLIDKRRQNIMKSPKRGGSCHDDSIPYLKELGVSIAEKRQAIQFTTNVNECVHRWAPYVQGFSASFVQSVFERYSETYNSPKILDPFAGCGTVLVQAKIDGYESFGVELNPLLRYIADVKLNSWTVRPSQLMRKYHSLRRDILAMEPNFLKSGKQFNPGVLINLKRIKGGIDSFVPQNEEQKKIKNLLKVAFASILIDASNLKRTPCLGYWKNKKIDDNAPFVLFNQKILEMAEDLRYLQAEYKDKLDLKSEVVCANSMDYKYNDGYDLAITSPPYMNGLDYVINYKIEMAWLDFITSHKEAKVIKDSMVVCDNVSKGLIKTFSESKYYTNRWLDEIVESIARNIQARQTYRRVDMPFIVQKYFDDMNKVIQRVSQALNRGGRFILVVGDSLIADTYVPTDLILAKIGIEHGLDIESIELARNRHSGQVRDYQLRETVITLRNCNGSR
jgi:DNA modification methylase